MPTDFEKLFSYLGRESNASPEKIISVINSAKSGEVSFEEEVIPQEREMVSTPDFFTTSVEEEISPMTKTFEEISKVSETSFSEEDEILSIFDNPFPTYNEILELTIPEFIKKQLEEVQKTPETPEKSLEAAFEMPEEEISAAQPEEVTEVSEDVFKLLGSFETEPITLEKEPFVEAKEVSFEEEQVKENFEPFELVGKPEEVEETFTLEGETGEYITESETEEISKGIEESEVFSFAETEVPFGESEIPGELLGSESSEIEKISRGFEESEEFSFEQPIEEFEETIGTGSEKFQKEVEQPFYKEAFQFEEPIGKEEEFYQPKPESKAVFEEKTEYREIPETRVSPRRTEEISEEEVYAVIEKLKSYPFHLRKAVKDIIKNELTSERGIKELFDYIYQGPSPKDLESYINKLVPFYRFEKAEERKEAGRKVIIAAERSKLDEFLEKALKKSVIFAGALVVLVGVGFFVVTTIGRNLYSNNLYEKGLRLIDTGYYDEAEENFKRAQDISGPKLEWYNKYAERYMMNRVPERAVTKLEEGLKFFPYDYKVSLNYVKALTSLDPPEYEKALSYAKEFKQKEQGSFRSIDIEGQLYINWGDTVKDKSKYFDAERIYMKFLKSKDNKHLGALFRLIPIYIRLDEKGKVDEIYDYIRNLNPKAVVEDAEIELAGYYINKKDLARAKKVLEDLQEIRSQKADYYYEMARFMNENLSYSKALEFAMKAVKANPKHYKAYSLIGDLKYYSKDILSAKENYLKSIQIEPNYQYPYLKMGHILYSEDKLNEALPYYTKALEIGEIESEEDLLKLSYNLARIYYKNRMLNEALKYLSYYYLRNYDHPVISYFMGNIYLEVGKVDLAIVQYNKVISSYNKILEKIPYIDPKIVRHQELISLLISTYNNLGVSYGIISKDEETIKKALMNFWEAKNYAEKLNAIYPPAEYNIKLVLHPVMNKYRNFEMDKNIPKEVPDSIKTYLTQIR